MERQDEGYYHDVSGFYYQPSALISLYHSVCAAELVSVGVTHSGSICPPLPTEHSDTVGSLCALIWYAQELGHNQDNKGESLKSSISQL